MEGMFSKILGIQNTVMGTEKGFNIYVSEFNWKILSFLVEAY